MRKRLALLVAGLAAAAAFAPLNTASAVCIGQVSPVGPDCIDPCAPVNAVLLKLGTHVDCVR